MQAVQVRLPVTMMTVLLLTACAPRPPAEDVTRPEPFPGEARELEAEGSFEAAARAWEELAAKAGPETASRAWLRAARAWLEAERLGAARQALARASRGRSVESAADHALTLAQLRLAEGRVDAADELLRELPDSLPAELRARHLDLQAETAFRLHRPQAAVEALLAYQGLDPDVSASEIRGRIWQGLALPYPDPAALIPDSEASDEVRAWLDLAQVVRSARSDRRGIADALLEWRDRHPETTVSRAMLERIAAEHQRRMSYPEHIALLLPLSGSLATSGTAVRDGFLAGLMTHPVEQRPELSVFDTEALGPVGAFYAAQDAGVDLVVGPLRKESVAQLAAAAPTIPVLALNYLPEDTEAPSSGFFQYALSPEDEATLAAERVLRDGRRTGIALIPQDEYGGRMLGAFRDRLDELDGLLLTWQAYDPALSDYSKPIKTALLLDTSEARHGTLERITGLDLQFEPRRRQDVSFIYLVAEPRQARLIRPQLRFHYATDLPVYASSDAYEDDPQRNADLQGVTFSVMPWDIAPDAMGRRVQTTLAEHWPERIRRRDRLVAMGVDAFDLIPSLLNGEVPLGEPLPGQTGLLSIDDGGRIHRRLHWARIVGSEAQLDERGWESLLDMRVAEPETAGPD